jgi:hypothetical protein
MSTLDEHAGCVLPFYVDGEFDHGEQAANLGDAARTSHRVGRGKLNLFRELDLHRSFKFGGRRNREISTRLTVCFSAIEAASGGFVAKRTNTESTGRPVHLKEVRAIQLNISARTQIDLPLNKTHLKQIFSPKRRHLHSLLG